ncbi:DegV family protein [Vallitalea sp.]|jgi:DegV family protein with EDD domain|uniref:DegV family protein n=1 Tax=Vallitalea sp. TaxID=1882829 RepID=UPI0025F4E3B9|nr:DegV family protein [Vallitalea sp.]MCT4687039.1 DegV family protein [Vallitalea sp.]
MNVKIITDSACDLPDDIISKYDIDVLPLIVYMNDKEYKDNVDVKPADLFKYMREGGIAKTAQATYESIDTMFRKYVDCDKPCIYISFSSELSGTYQTAKIVEQDIKEEYPDFDLTVIDSKAASLGFGLIVYLSALTAEDGASKEKVIDRILHCKKHMEHIFTVDDLEYLYRGGRVSKTAAVIGSVLHIKPILDVEDGKLIPVEKVRGRKKSINRMIDIVEERGDRLGEQIVAINHADDMETALKVKAKLEEKFGIKEFVIRDVGCAIGAHSGPGTLSIFFLNKLD